MTRCINRSRLRNCQRADELEGFIGYVTEANATSYLEIGCRYGDTFHAVVSAMPKGSVAVAVELPGEKWGKSDSLPYLESAVADLCADGYAASLVLGDSKALGVRQIAMARGPYDAIFIDGDHRLEGVSADWNNYSLLASPKGIVAFHDIDAHHQRKHMKIDVPHLWKRLKKQYRAVELIGTQRAMGIGIVWPGQPL